MKKSIILLIALSALNAQLFGACDANCEFIKKILADEPNRFHSFHDFDGVGTVQSPAGGNCQYSYTMASKSAGLFCFLAYETTAAKATEVFDSTLKSLPSILGDGWTIGKPESGLGGRMTDVEATQSATGVKVKLEAAAWSDTSNRSWAAVRVIGRQNH